jgi:thioesterase domain-containing protein/acyl carrier protein
VNSALESGGRVYRTGDLVRQYADGRVEYLGRSDHQVKLRGFRIELGEIEIALRRHPEVSEAVAVARGQATDKRLIAYVVPLQGRNIDLDELRALVRRALPEFMVPQWIVSLPELPLTPNGKIDRKALPDPDTKIEQRPQYVPPDNLIEGKIAQAFREVLGFGREIGVDEDFFAIGGDSLRAVELLSVLDAAFDRRLPLRELLTSATVRGVAEALGAHAFDTRSLLVPLQTRGKGVPLFCIHPLGGHVFCYLDLAQALRDVRPVFGLRAQGIEGEAKPHSDIESMAACYVDQIRTVLPSGPFALCGWSLGGMVALEIAIQLQAKGLPVALLVAIDTAWPMVARPILERIRRRGPGGVLRVPLERWERSQKRRLQAKRQEPLILVQRAADQASMSYASRGYSGDALLVRSRVELPTAEPDLAEWKRLVSNLETFVLPGGHWDVLRQPMVQMLANELQRRLIATAC